MSESADAPADTLFRPGKRRKVFRKRNFDDDHEETAVGTQLPKEAKASHSGGHVEDSTNLSSVVRRPNIKKYGIGFGGIGNPSVVKEASSTDNALVPSETQVPAAAQADRFVKPMGKAEVIEDKHLKILGPEQGESSARFKPKTPLTHAERNKDYLTRAQRKQQKAMRRQPKRGEDDVVRDDMIDQIFREGQVPMYDQAQSKAETYSDDGLDHDEAAARAFKARFLADMEMQRRRKPSSTSATTKSAAPASTGPKLGGSRSMREKMKALEAAKEKTGVKK
ncbi:uncharacterized protein MYCFIDRAFT_88083 [Pseudocercospora fijiensis CIRAD86]|uniref:Uncharacterized protein n=1 Tax=Pseudocercospora fijiensis (strain CIRAD86) TaxID=383855 RepID=M2ZR25_PSEFD|nr:uncharacterized protein MYCFIDRAFT_88083 [Pseudocercospora fijiensis CIRAD86]EME81524.1 hypothetical protein MYCFIDRAFT_88083 [Pseudocercospora fijiensis CIRAD86]